MSSAGRGVAATNDELLALVNSRSRYDDFKRFLRYGRVVQNTPVGPLYKSVPRSNALVDSYDMDKQVMSTDREFVRVYSRILHANLTGQYRLATDGGVPRLATPRMLDQHSLATYFAPFRPVLSRPLDESIMSRWDRNVKPYMPEDQLPVSVGPDKLFFLADSLTWLYSDYRGNGDDLASRIGVPLNSNSVAIVRYVKAMADSALTYRQKVRAVAQLMVNRTQLTNLRDRMLKRLSNIQATKLDEIRQIERQALTDEQRQVVSEFADQFREAARQILEYGLEAQRQAEEDAAWEAEQRAWEAEQERDE